MKAVILAAGVGKRLWPITQHRPKCLIEIGGETLLHRYLEALASLGIQRADIVVGYKQEMIRAAIEANACGVRVNFLVNEQFQRGSISSLWIARTALDDDAIVMDADVLFHREILRRLVQSPYPNALLMDDSVKQTGEECMVVVEGGRVIALTKTMPARYGVAAAKSEPSERERGHRSQNHSQRRGHQDDHQTVPDRRQQMVVVDQLDKILQRWREEKLGRHRNHVGAAFQRRDHHPYVRRYEDDRDDGDKQIDHRVANPSPRM
jgi:GTP:adenosylcobinamide-phosphate guanylyltransferase